jgi:virginiamycin B lyase
MVQRHKGGFVAALRLAAAIGLLGWSASAGAQSITEYPIPTSASGPNGIAAGPDGALWFTESNANKIGRITTAGVITEFGIPTPSSFPIYITAGPDGALWFAENNGNKIGRITTAGAVTEYPIPTSRSSPGTIAAGPDGALWFTEGGSFNIQTGAVPGKIGRITTAGAVTAEYPLPAVSGPAAAAISIATGPDGALWFGANSVNNLITSINRITTSGTVTPYALLASCR